MFLLWGLPRHPADFQANLVDGCLLHVFARGSNIMFLPGDLTLLPPGWLPVACP